MAGLVPAISIRGAGPCQPKPAGTSSPPGRPKGGTRLAGQSWNHMPLQNRVTPFGEFIATPARGLLMGNRGGRLHDDARTLGARRWASKQWICCNLDFDDRHRAVWANGYSELFFLDEVTAFAAGHRPCFECRRREAEHFAALFAGVVSNSVHSRASGNPGTQSQAHELVARGPRFPPSRSALRRTRTRRSSRSERRLGRGDERICFNASPCRSGAGRLP
jgi:hypothetical protein